MNRFIGSTAQTPAKQQHGPCSKIRSVIVTMLIDSTQHTQILYHGRNDRFTLNHIRQACFDLCSVWTFAQSFFSQPIAKWQYIRIQDFDGRGTTMREGFHKLDIHSFNLNSWLWLQSFALNELTEHLAVRTARTVCVVSWIDLIGNDDELRSFGVAILVSQDLPSGFTVRQDHARQLCSDRLGGSRGKPIERL